MYRLYKTESSYPKCNAQRNLQGRTHYVDDDTLRGFHCRIISARHTDNGLLFAIVTSDAADYQNKTREFRYAIFDITGTVINRPELGKGFRTSAQATKAMWEALNAIDAKAVALEALQKKAARSRQRSVYTSPWAVQSNENVTPVRSPLRAT